MRAIVRREFHADLPAVLLVIEGPFSAETVYWDADHAERALELIQRALPELRRSEASVEDDWRAWCARNEADAGQGTDDE